MGLDVWFREDLLRVLQAAESACMSTVNEMARQESAAVLEQYVRGYRAALAAVALACGLVPEEPAPAPYLGRRGGV